jgi:hypothetical protein
VWTPVTVSVTVPVAVPATIAVTVSEAALSPLPFKAASCRRTAWTALLAFPALLSAEPTVVPPLRAPAVGACVPAHVISPFGALLP